MMTVTETAKLLNVSREAVLKYIKLGVYDSKKNRVKLKAKKEHMPVRLQWLISHQNIEEFKKLIRQ